MGAAAGAGERTRDRVVLCDFAGLSDFPSFLFCPLLPWICFVSKPLESMRNGGGQASSDAPSQKKFGLREKSKCRPAEGVQPAGDMRRRRVA